ncbi:MAG TPA: branched-chain amino acid ABC transporter permease [Mycobacteriales bacterium]|nr:branched-chain amino acid ABC transporter permease [Mycobacteriales bacterium]
MTIIQAALTGALIGGLYALMATGLSVTWGVLRVINLAHFAMILLGAYLTFQLASSTGLDPILTIVITAPALFVLGAAVQWAYDRFGVAEFTSLLVSFGILIIAIQVVTMVWSADFRRMADDVNPYATRSWTLGRLVFPVTTVLAFGLAVVLVAALHLVLRHTFAGRGMRAIAQDRAVAAAFGVDHRRLSLVLGGVAGATAAAAGMVFALTNSLSPSVAYEWFGIVFAVVIVGGIGQVIGTFVAGIAVGVVSAVVSAAWSPSTAPIVLFSAIVLVLIVRPQGLFALRTAGAGR